MRVVITGAKGQLGTELKNQLKELPFIQVYGLGKSDLDMRNEVQVQEVLHKLSPHIVINCGAYTAVDLCETNEEEAYAINAKGAYYLAKVSQQLGAKFIQVSTDYVFNGDFNLEKQEVTPEEDLLTLRYKKARERHPWMEEDAVDPQTIYGKSKLAGEEAVRRVCEKHFIIRTAWLYGEGNNFVRTMLQLAQKNQVINVVADQFGTPTSTKDLARVILALMQTEAYGTYHATCEGACSWYELACEIFKLKELDVKVNPVTSEVFARPAKRPFYSVLENANLKQLGLNTFRPWQEALADYLESDTVWQQENLGGQANG